MQLEEKVSMIQPKKETTSFYVRHQGFIKGVLLTIVLAVLAGQIAKLPFFSIMGIMIISILLGMTWKQVMGVDTEANVGITFSSKILLRLGIILMGLRLNIAQIFEAGLSVLLIDAIVIGFTLLVMLLIGKLLKVNTHLNTLIATGTAICGAAAIVAVAPLIKGKNEYTALAVACIAILGTFGALGYIFLYPLLELEPTLYGALVGATLHELAHVIAAAVPGGETAMEMALIVKLGRVALLIPVALVIGYFFAKHNKQAEQKSIKNLPVPWFIFSFLAMSLVNTLGWLPQEAIDLLIMLSVYLMAMAMAGLGLTIKFNDFKKVGFKPVVVGIIGFILLVAIGPLLLHLL